MIPKIIWQTYKCSYNELPQHVKKLSDTWKDLNPEYKYIYLSDEDARVIIEDNFDADWLELWDTVPVGVMRGDIIRYLIIYLYGGVYVDMDTECREPISTWINGRDGGDYAAIFAPEVITHVNTLCQWAFAAEPGLPIFEYMLNNVKSGLMSIDWTDPEVKANYKHYVLHFGGPTAFYSSIFNFLNIETKLDLLDNIDNIRKDKSVVENRIYFYGGQDDFDIFRHNAISHKFAGDEPAWSNTWTQWKKQTL